MRPPFVIAGTQIAAGSRAMVDVPMPRLSSHTRLGLPVHVVHGKQQGPALLVSAAIHGDELNGIEIIRRLMAMKGLARLRGTLVAVPLVNAYGLISESRYLPDRRDLNRSFPGSQRGSLAARLAYLFMEEIVKRCTYGIDLHTGAIHRKNLPQVRANLDEPETERLARSFGVPVLLNSSLRDGSLRAAAAELGIPMLLYEAGEALRFDEIAIRAGLNGIKNVMRSLGMLPPQKRRQKRIVEPFVARNSSWTRAPESGLLNTAVPLGARVDRADVLGHIDDPYSGTRHEIHATNEGVVIGRLERPLVHEGDAVYHIARFEDDVAEVADQVESFQMDHADHALPS